MKRFSIVFILLFFCANLSAQESSKPKISIAAKDTSYEDIFKEIEHKSSFRFFYAPAWIKDQKGSKDYINLTAEAILKDLLENSNLNFFIDKQQKVIITQNTIIYDQLPEGYFGVENQTTEEDQVLQPVFIDRQKAAQGPIETVRIGKADQRVRKARFTLSGIIRNAQTNQPINNLAIFVKNKSTGTTTNSRGYYELQLAPGVHLIETQLPGYETVRKSVIIYNDGRLNLTILTRSIPAPVP